MSTQQKLKGQQNLLCPFSMRNHETTSYADQPVCWQLYFSVADRSKLNQLSDKSFMPEGHFHVLSAAVGLAVCSL